MANDIIIIHIPLQTSSKPCFPAYERYKNDFNMLMECYTHTLSRDAFRSRIIMRIRRVVQYGIMKNGLRSKYARHRESFSSKHSFNSCGEIVSVFSWIIIDKVAVEEKNKTNLIFNETWLQRFFVKILQFIYQKLFLQFLGIDLFLTLSWDKNAIQQKK